MNLINEYYTGFKNIVSMEFAASRVTDLYSDRMIDGNGNVNSKNLNPLYRGLVTFNFLRLKSYNDKINKSYNAEQLSDLYVGLNFSKDIYINTIHSMSLGYTNVKDLTAQIKYLDELLQRIEVKFQYLNGEIKLINENIYNQTKAIKALNSKFNENFNLEDVISFFNENEIALLNHEKGALKLVGQVFYCLCDNKIFDNLSTINITDTSKEICLALNFKMSSHQQIRKSFNGKIDKKFEAKIIKYFTV